MGWEWLECKPGRTGEVVKDPGATGRESFNEVILEERLRGAIRRINIDVDGKPWLDDGRIGQAVSAIRRLRAKNVMEANREAWTLIQQGTQVEPAPEHTGHTGEATVRYIDFEEPENNDFLVINQFRIDRPGSGEPLYPDVVLFVNGLPLVVVECKASTAGADPVGDALHQLFRYEGRREDNAGIPRLCRFRLREGCRSRARSHFIDWYTDHALPWLTERLERWNGRMAANIDEVQVLDLGNRWGSCRDRRVHFHWRTILLPPRIVDYVIVHELAHVHVQNHSEEFWRRVERAMPDYESRKQWLAEEGARFDC